MSDEMGEHRVGVIAGWRGWNARNGNWESGERGCLTRTGALTVSLFLFSEIMSIMFIVLYFSETLFSQSSKKLVDFTLIPRGCPWTVTRQKADPAHPDCGLLASQRKRHAAPGGRGLVTEPKENFRGAGQRGLLEPLVPIVGRGPSRRAQPAQSLQRGPVGAAASGLQSGNPLSGV